MGRGPSYPYVDLEQAIGLSRKIYDYAKRGAAPTDAVVSEALKYSPTSSGAQKVIAALRSFGLIEDAPGGNGKAIKLTPRTIRILLDEPDSAERLSEIKKAALSPKWYEYSWKKWGADMPPAMKSNLLIEHGFVDSTIDGFLKDYRKSIAFAGLLDAEIPDKSGNSSEDRKNFTFNIGDWVQWESKGDLRMPEAKQLTRFSPDGDYAFVEGSLTGIPVGELIPADPPEVEPSKLLQNIFAPLTKPASSATGVNMKTEKFATAEGISAQIEWPSEITTEAFEDFLYKLEGLKRAVARAIKKELPEGVPSNSEGR